MKIFKLLLLSIALFMTFGSSAQVAINTDGLPADGSAILDIKSDNKGLLPPRMTSSQRDDISSPATGLTVFVTNDNSYYTYYGSTWNKISNWTLSNTSLYVDPTLSVGIGTASPDATLHIDGSLKYVDGNESAGKILASDASGNVSWTDGNTLGFSGWVVNGSSVYNMSPLVGIGTSSPSAGLEIVNSTADNSLRIENNSTTASKNYGINTYLSGASNEQNIGSYIDVANTGVGSHYGSYYKLRGTGGGAQVGSYIDISNTGNNYHYGILTSLSGTSSGRQYGIYHNISNSGNSLHYGTFNSISGPGTGKQYGAYQSISNTGSGVHYGNYNELTGTGIGVQFGNFTYIYNTGSAKHYGSYDSLTGSGIGSKYGVYSVIPTSAGGTHYGLYSSAVGDDNYSAYLKGRVYASDKVGIGTEYPQSKLSIYNSDTDTTISLLNNSTSSGNHFGVYNIMTGTGTGRQYGNYNKIDNSTHDYHYGNFNSISGSGAGKHYGVYNSLYGSGIGANYGVYNYLSSSGGANKYGTYSEISGQAGGIHYAVYGKVFDDGSNYAGYFYGPVYTSSKMGIGVKKPEVMLDVRGDFQLVDTANDVSASIESTVSGAILSIKSAGSNLAQVKFINNENIASIGYDVDNNSVFISQGVNTIFIKGGNILPQTNGVQSLGNNSSSWNNIWFDDLRNQGAASFTDRKVTEEILLFPPLAKKSGNSDNKTKKGLAKLNPSSLPNALYEDNSILIDEVAVYNYKANYEQQLQIEELKAKIEQQNEKIEQLIKLVSEK